MPSGAYRNEAAYKDRFFKELSAWFAVEPEQRVRHIDGRTMRIDAILRPAFVPNAVLGLEVKFFDSRKDVSIGDYWKRRSIYQR